MHQDDTVSTLRYWIDVEALTAPDAEEAQDRGRDHFVTHVRDGVLPWDAPDQPGRPHKHFVRFGPVPRRCYEQELLATVRAKPAPDHDSGGKKDHKTFTYLGAFEVDQNGSPQTGSLQMAAFATAFSSLRPGKVVVFDRYQQTMAEFFDILAQRLKEKEARADWSFVRTLVEKSLDLLQWTPSGMDEAPEAIVVSKAVVDEDGRARNPQLEPVNGFYLDDIGAVARDIEARRPCGLVASYLAEPDEGGRQDCTKEQAIGAALASANTPAGRWPSEFPLTLMQQVAVNEAFRRLAPGGLFSINGPPGTGKTTLLMDVVAAVVVERAKVLASFDRPKAAFREGWKVKYPDLPKPATVFALDARLHDFSMVVASSNNGAVENITRELPNAAKVAARFLDEAAYFAPTATALLRARPADEDEDDGGDDGEEAAGWGLVSAALGKKGNRLAFANTLAAKNRNGQEEPWNIYRQFAETAGCVDWEKAKRDFLQAVADVDRLKGEIDRIEVLDSRLGDLGRSEADLAQREIGWAEAIKKAEANVAKLQEDLQEQEDELASADRDVDLRKPGGLDAFLARLPLPVGLVTAARAKVAAYDAAVDRRSLCDAARLDARKALKAAKAGLEAAIEKRRQVQDAVAKTRASIAAISAEAGRLRAGHPDLADFGRFLSASEGDRQQMLPRSSGALNEARARVFVKAMALHLAFIINSEGVFERNLKRALGMLKGDINLKPVLPAAAKDLWATIFLLVPVVSTTFASFARCFGDMPRGGIAWLFVDEAGQAVPQHAVGALARAKRALVVGDPLQVEPVITLDKNIDAELLKRHGAPKRHLSTGTSMQALVDQNNPFGTTLKSHKGEPVWVGSPLKVHRRCVDPMFTISNKIAYNESMVLGRGKAEQEAKANAGDAAKGKPPRALIAPSMWIDAQGTEGCENHYIPAQAEAAYGIVKAFMANGWLHEKRRDGLPDLFIISPFKSAAKGMRDRLWRSRRDWAPGVRQKEVEGWLDRCVGTVHTFQGKEAETVVLLLGGKTAGAVKWAAETPNILNVAVTRAQRRVYVVGDWKEWTQWPLVGSTMGNPAWRMPMEDAKKMIDNSIATAVSDQVRPAQGLARLGRLRTGGDPVG